VLHVKAPKVGGKIAIERMKPEDLVEIVRLEQGSFTDPWPKKGFEVQLEDGASIMLVARLEDGASVAGEMVGYLCAYHIFEELQLASLAVKEAFRRRGIARKLIAEMIRQGRGEEASKIWLDVRESNVAARRLYENLGFRGVYRRKNYYRKPKEDALVMFRLVDKAAWPSAAQSLGRAVGG